MKISKFFHFPPRFPLPMLLLFNTIYWVLSLLNDLEKGRGEQKIRSWGRGKTD